MQRVVRTQLLEKVKQLQENVRGQLVQDGDAKSLPEQISTMIGQMGENINEAFESLEQEHTKWEETLEKVAHYVKKENEQFQDEGEFKELALEYVPFIFEEEVANYVLPQSVRVPKVGMFRLMTKWLNREIQRGTKDGEMARNRWEEVKKILNWDDHEHREVLGTLKHMRSQFFHPDSSSVNLELAKNQVGEYFPEEQQPYCFGIIRTIEELRCRRSSGLRPRK